MIKLSLFTLAIFSSTVTAGGEITTHCDTTEQIIFSCQLQGSDKVVSLCASNDLAADTGYLQFRLGPAGAVEAFPESRENTQSLLMYNHYSRAQFDLTNVTFRNADNEYVIYDYYNGEEETGEEELSVEEPDQEESGDEAPVNETGLRINEASQDCDGPAINHLLKLEGLLPCDKENTDIGNCE